MNEGFHHRQEPSVIDVVSIAAGCVFVAWFVSMFVIVNKIFGGP